MENITKYQKWIEGSTWIIIVIVIFGVRFLPQKLIDADQAYILIGAIVSLALLYYLVIYKYFNKTSRMYLKSIADIVLIGVLIHLMKDNGQYFFALYFLPIAAAALELQFINALLIATIASVFVVFEIFLGSFDLLPKQGELFEGVWQIGLILLITIFCRFLAIQIREEKNAKEEAQARQKALEAESAKEKDFMSLTSHQLYTPLSIIRGFASMLDDQTLGKLTSKQKNASSEIYQNTKRMVALVSELLNISRIQAGTLKLCYGQIDFAKMIPEIVDSFNQTKKNEHVKITTHLPENIATVEADSDKIRQVLYNLIDNALKYANKGEIKLALSQDRKHTTISISDEGAGIKPEDYEKIFEPFFRGKNILELDNKGTGLGLYIAKMIIEKHHGRIWFASKENRGSTFSFSVPNVKIV